MIGFLVLFDVVDPQDKCLQRALSWCRNDDLLRACSDVALGLIGFDEKASRLNDVIHTHIFPRQGLWSLSAGHDAFNLVAVYLELVRACDLHVVLEPAVGGVAIHLVNEVLGIC